MASEIAANATAPETTGAAMLVHHGEEGGVVVRGELVLTVGDATAVKVFWKGRLTPLPERPGHVVKGYALGAEAHE